MKNINLKDRAILQPDLFDIYIAISPSIWWNDEGLVRQAGKWLSTTMNLDIDLYRSVAPTVLRTYYSAK